MNGEQEDLTVRAPRARAGSPCAFDPNLSAHDLRRDSVYSTSSDARDRNASISMSSSSSSSLSDYINRRGSNDSVFSFASNSRSSVSGGAEDHELSSNAFRKRKPRSLRNSFETLQLGLAPDPEDVRPLPPLQLEDPSTAALTSQLLGEHDHQADCGECGGYESEEGWGGDHYYSGLLSPISEASSGSVESCTSPLTSPAALSLWQGLLANAVLSPPQTRRVRRPYQRRSQGCNCEKSKCLKLYCECFAKQAVCGPECNCKNCMNTPANFESREQAIHASMDRSTTAFFRSPDTGLEHKGCRCKKSQCRKNYCECFSVSRSCTQDCRCTDCANVHGVKIPHRLPSLVQPQPSAVPPRPPPPPPASLQMRAPPPPPVGNALSHGASRLPPPPPPPLPPSAPNCASLVVSKFRKGIIPNRPNELSPHGSMSWPASFQGERSDGDSQSPFAGLACPSLVGSWSGDEAIPESWEDNQTACGFFSEDLEEAKKPPLFERTYSPLTPDLPFPLEQDCGYCPDLLMDALASSTSR